MPTHIPRNNTLHYILKSMPQMKTPWMQTQIMKASYALNPQEILLTNKELTSQCKASSHHTTLNAQTENPLLPEFLLVNWPVSKPNNTCINNMVQSGKWEMNPLQLFTEDGKDIVPPLHYETLLLGSITQIAFILKYSQVKTPNGFKTTFSIIIPEIIVLKKPHPSHAASPQTPSKKWSLPWAPSFLPKKKDRNM
ncbi:hypothetical protein BS47DRAFT_1369533 [Hydnum rufescens UP504]|uniref:Uncharacterized protein n=1 Tax=Hydnum rufescens UP504 TaxID=1448309 RepID=A0A9P6ADP3_9AGAM|nr:hypothetical protein BS47DRAFT_1369533 [Hydnum rufescens UP504]